MLELPGSTFAGQDDVHRFASLMAHAVNDGQSTTISLDAADKVVLAGVHKAQLTLADVHFV